jgi:hypothetical protein
MMLGTIEANALPIREGHANSRVGLVNAGNDDLVNVKLGDIDHYAALTNKRRTDRNSRLFKAAVGI